MHTYSRLQWVRLRELAGRAYELELRESLLPLSLKFEEWKDGKISSVELGRLVHEYDSRDARKLWVKYDNSQYDIQVALAFVKGQISGEEIGSELMTGLQSAIEFYRQHLK